MTPAFVIVAYVLIPLWLLAGVADYLCHRASRIERTAGWEESIFHLAMFAEAGVPALASLVFKSNALIMLALFIGFLLHEVTALWDVRYAVIRRDVSPVEQHVHSFLELIPFTILALLASENPDQARALIGAGNAPADFSLQLRDPPLPLAYLVALGVAIVALNVWPYIEELVRGVRARQFNV